MDKITDKHIDEGWFDIARPGTWRGSEGGQEAEVQITKEDLEQMAADYSPEIQEAPIRFDHGTGPAYGWIDELRMAGEVLQAKLGHVSAELRQALKNGSYRARSAEMYRPHKSTGRAYLGGLAFLGAKAPAVKGLRPVPQLFTEGAANSLVWFFEPRSDRGKPGEPEKSITEEENSMSMDEKQVTELAETAGKKGAMAAFKEFFKIGDKDGAGDLADVKVELNEARGEVKKLTESLESEKKRADGLQAKLDEQAKVTELAEFTDALTKAKAESKITPAEEKTFIALGEKLDADGRKTILADVQARKNNGILGTHADEDGNGGDGSVKFAEQKANAEARLKKNPNDESAKETLEIIKFAENDSKLESFSDAAKAYARTNVKS